MSERASRPLREVFLDRVIRIEAAQRERAAVTDEDAAGFFVDGRLLGDPELPDYRWSLDEPELFARRGAVQFLGVLGVGGGAFPEKPTSAAMQRAWEAALEAWQQRFVAPLRNGELIATATHPTTGERRDLELAEWIQAGLVLNVRDGTLFAKGRDGKPVEQWEAITLREAAAARTPKPARSTPKRAATPKQKLAKRRTKQTWKKPLKSQPIPIRHELILDILLPECPDEDLREISTTTVLVPKVAEGWEKACKARGRFGHVKRDQPDYPVPRWDTIDRVKKLYDGRRRRRR
jgi:hypothetical protein